MTNATRTRPEVSRLRDEDHEYSELTIATNLLVDALTQNGCAVFVDDLTRPCPEHDAWRKADPHCQAVVKAHKSSAGHSLHLQSGLAPWLQVSLLSRAVQFVFVEAQNPEDVAWHVEKGDTRAAIL